MSIIMVIFNYKLITMKYLSNIEKRIQDWIDRSILGVITSLFLQGITVTTSLLLSCIPFIWVVFNMEQTWIHVVTFILTVPLTGIVTVVTGWYMLSWTNGEISIFKSNKSK